MSDLQSLGKSFEEREGEAGPGAKSEAMSRNRSSPELVQLRPGIAGYQPGTLSLACVLHWSHRANNR